MKILFKIFLLFLLAFGITLLVLKWKDRTRDSSDVMSPIEIGEAQQVVESLRAEAGRGTIRLEASTLRRMLIASLAGSKSGQVVLENSSGVRASIADGLIEVGVVLSTVGLEEKLEGSEDENLDRLAAILAWLPGDGVFIGARGVPTVRDGALSLDTETLELQVGPLKVSPDDLVERLDLSAERLAEELRLEIDGLRLRNVTVDGEVLVVEATPE